jgi:peptidyl-prolyl cis-trans isomerase D
MLQRIRDGLQAQKWVTYTVIGALILVFAAWGAYGIVDLSIGTSNFAAKANGEKISLQEAQETWQRQQMMWQRQFGADLPAEMKTRMQDETLEALISDSLLQQHAQNLGYRVSDQQVHDRVRQEPAFQVEGKYSADAAKYALVNAGLTVQEFEAGLRRDLQRQQIQGAILASNFMTPTEKKRLQSLQGEQREVRYVSLLPEKFAAQAVTDDAAVQAYYTKNQARFMTPESVRLAYGELRSDQLASQIVLSDEDLKAAYEKNKDSFVQPERRQARHILIESGSDDAAALKKAQDVLAEANAGKDFAELAKKYSQDLGSAQNGGDLGWAQRGALDASFAPIEDAEFSMKVGEVRGPVKSKFGYHIIKLDAIEPGHGRTFEEARSELESQLRSERSSERFGDVQESLQQKLEQPGADFDALVKEFNLQPGEVNEYQRGAGGAPLGASPELDQVVFSSSVLDEKRVGGPVALGEDRIVIVKALEHRKPAPKPLASVREEIVKTIRDEFGRAEATKAAEAARAKLAAGGTFDDVVKDLGVTVEPPRFIGRDDPSVPAAIRTAAFDSAKPAIGKSVYRITNLENGGAAVIGVSAVRLDPNFTPQLMASQQREVQGRQGQGDAVAYLEELRRSASVSKNPKAFE